MSFFHRWLALCLFAGFARAERVEFRAPRRAAYELDSASTAPIRQTSVTPQTLTARPVGGGKPVQITSRLVLQLTDTNRLTSLCATHGLTIVSDLDNHTFLLEATTARASVHAAAALAQISGVEAAVPVMRRLIRLHFAYAPTPNDPYFAQQTYLEAPPTNAPSLAIAPDLNIRGAWAFTRGAGITVAFSDDGVELTHPDLAPNATGPHHNFFTDTAMGTHGGTFQYHGTAVAGLIAARGGNQLGMTGTAPLARLASWIIFNTVNDIPDDAGMGAMFGFASNGSNAVAVQNHSWGNSDFDVLEMSLPEMIGISNAVTTGRNGLGVVMVRSAGNTRAKDYSFNPGIGDANLDEYANDTRQITVAAVRNDGRVASYSAPGACVLVAAMGGDFQDSASPGLLTTDRLGALGVNRTQTAGDPNSWDYTSGSTGFTGTSAAAPLVSGVAALVLAANPRLGWRDVQQVLALSARHVDLADPDRTTNGAGFTVSHNVGFGIPDAGAAVRLAQAWSNRPAAVERHYTNASRQNIPDDGLKVFVTGPGVPSGLAAIPASGTIGLHPDAPTAVLPLFNAGPNAAPINTNLAGSGALLTRQTSVTAAQNIAFAANAGSAFAVIINNQGTTDRLIVRDTGFVAIPAVLVGHDDGEALRSLISFNPNVRVGLGLNSANFAFSVPDALLVEHVQVRVNWSHPRMADLRVTLQSPAGTVSILHRPGASTNALPAEWTYSSVHHLGESSQGTWTVAVTDEATGITGTVNSVELILQGVPLTDTDADGLDDRWERAHFGSLQFGPRDDPDHDGWNNAAEQLRGSDPLRNETPLQMDIARISPGSVRLSWPGRNEMLYDVLQGKDADSATNLFQQVPGRFPESGLVLPANLNGRFFRVRETP